MNYQENSEHKWGVSHIVPVSALHINNVAVFQWERQEYGKVPTSPLMWNRVNPLMFFSTNAPEQQVSRCILCCGENAVNIVSWQPAVLICGMFHYYIQKRAPLQQGDFSNKPSVLLLLCSSMYRRQLHSSRSSCISSSHSGCRLDKA